MKIFLFIIILTFIPSTVWADQVSREEAQELFEQQVAIPCMRAVLRKTGLPESQVPPLKLWVMSQDPDTLELGIQVLLETPKKDHPVLLRFLKERCLSGLKKK